MCFAVSGVLAQKTKVSGTVYDGETKEPMPFVNVYFQGTKTGTTTNLDGKYILDSYYASDTVAASFVGYSPAKQKVKVDETQTVDLYMGTSSVALREVVIRVDKKKENPAHPIIRKVLENKNINDREKLAGYEYEVYNKIEFDLNNITDDFTDRKAFRSFDFIFDNIDTAGPKDYLPIFISESLSDFYYRKNPKGSFEKIKATKVSGIDNQSVSQFLGDMYQNVNIYDNNISVFGKSFVSPISTNGFFFYKYYLIDSLTVDNKWCYHIKFKGKRKQDPVFEGDLFIHDTTYAVKRAIASINEDANINFVNGFEVLQEYDEVQPEVWMITKDQLVVDFNLGEKAMGLYGRKTTTYKNHVINDPKDGTVFNNTNNIEVAKDSDKKGDEFWSEARHEKLADNEQAIYTMIDTLKQVPQFKTYLDVLNIIFTGYKVAGPLEFGPYYSLYSFNPVEGNRFRLGIRTSNDFSTRLAVGVFGAYGLKDQKLKYGGNIFYFISKDQPRISVEARYSLDVEQLGQSRSAFQQDNFLSSFFRRNPATKLTLVEDWELNYNHEWFYGFSNRVIARKRSFTPLGSLSYIQPFSDAIKINIPAIHTTEIGLYTRFAYKERYVAGEFDRISLGTKYPVLEALVTKSLPGVLNGLYNYTKLELAISHKLSLGYIGNFRYGAKAGKVLGSAPYPLLEVHQGNETFFYLDNAFNTMNFFEFVSDQFVSVYGEHHFEGLFFNRLPLFRKLKWREVVSAKAVYGSYNPKNSEILELSENINTFSRNKPFIEAAVGVENIFKFLRLDALYRLSYLDNPNIVKFGIRAKLQLTF